MSRPLDDPRLARGMAAQMDLRRSKLAEGARPIGWKVGFGAPAGLAKLKIAAPIVGFLLDRNVVASGGTVAISGFAMPVAEPEIAVEIGTDLPGGGDEAAAAAAIAALGPAIELADFSPLDDPEPILSGNIFHRHVIFGPRSARKHGDTTGLVSTVLRDGTAVPAPADVTANTGDLVRIVRHVADTLAALGETLRTGDVIIAGSITPPLMLTMEDRVLTHRLAPIGEVTVRLS
ncbi:fumarylacetoacetate hydrolase family protein [Rhodoplanes azumiensis]|uniref:Fumarylacetoacetate hydrolase family protein n=1 Tax=Rhodoplanes azumiensis TaxID=1897628 RepID=A0ABW5AHR2_9BRAD